MIESVTWLISGGLPRRSTIAMPDFSRSPWRAAVERRRCRAPLGLPYASE